MAIEGQMEQERNGKADDPELNKHNGTQQAAAATEELNEDERAAYEKIKQQLEEERRTSAEATRRAQQAEEDRRRYEERAQQGERSVKQANLAMLDRAIEASDAAMANLKREMAAAYQEGDFDKVANCQAQISEAAAQKVQLVTGRRQLEAMPEQVVQQQQQQHADPFEAALTNYTPRTQSWIRNHPDVLRDPKTMQRAMGYHNLATAEGYVPDSDAYFDFLEQQLGYKENTQQNQRQDNPQRKTVAAAPGRSGVPGSTRNGSSLSVRDMTPAMMEAAKMADITPEEYLKNYQELIRSGEIQPMH